MKTAAQRKFEERRRKYVAGIQRVEFWLHPFDVPRVREYVALLAKKRAAVQTTVNDLTKGD